MNELGGGCMTAINKLNVSKVTLDLAVAVSLSRCRYLGFIIIKNKIEYMVSIEPKVR